jgi:8-oxo-dGTP pyrophosphatase MutT (NUDIX family)
METLTPSTGGSRVETGVATRYVAGFLFNACCNEVVLIRKQRPVWQRGLLNGIGGHIEPNEGSAQAMAREFAEETGVAMFPSDWKLFCRMAGTNNDGESFSVDFYWAIGDVANVRARTDEAISVIALDKLTALRIDTVGNVPWLVAMARDFAAGVYPPQLVVAHYAQPVSPDSTSDCGISVSAQAKSASSAPSVTPEERK